jgi:DNA-binding transcriptional regulator YiaG
MVKSAVNRDKPYPLRCAECWKPELWPATIPYDAEILHDGRLHKFHIPALNVDQCRACGEIMFSNRTSQELSTALRAHVGLLQPSQIRERLDALGLSPEQFAEGLGVDHAAVADWLEGLQIPSRAMDNLMRVFLQFEEVRTALSASRENTFCMAHQCS